MFGRYAMRKVALIGAGGMGSVHASCYPDIGNAQLVAVMDVRPEVASAAAEKYGAQAYSDAEKLFSEADFDTVDICTPTPSHIEYIRMAAAAGKAICCEKPFCRTIEECREAISICNKANVPLFVAHVLRWFPEFRRAKELVASGSVGEAAVIRTSRVSGHPGGWNDWFRDYSQSGGVVLDLSIHDLDWLLWTFGPVNHVFARGLGASREGVSDYALVTIRFKNGAIAHVEGSWAAPTGFAVSFEIAGDKGLLEFSDKRVTTYGEAHWNADQSGVTESVSSPVKENPYLLELRSFYDCLETGTPFAVTPKEAMNAVALALAANESIKTGQPVKP
jgi:predicted dehydrogenase